MKRTRKPRDDFVLGLQNIGAVDIESVRPERFHALRVDEFCVDAYRSLAAQYAAFQRILHVEVGT